MLHDRISEVLDRLMTTLEKYERQTVYDPPSFTSPNVHAAFLVVIQSALSWNEKMEASASKFKGNSRGENESQV